mgnify:CR=1 FL=1
MTIQENARFTVYRLASEYMENIDSIYLWDLAKMIKNAFNIGAISKPEVEMLGYNLSRLTFDEIMNA